MVGLGEERMRTKRAGGRGGDIPGSKNTDERAYYWQSHPLWARQREGNKEQDNAWKRESQSEREASKPLKKTWGWHLHVHLFTLNIPPVSVSLGESPCFFMTCYLIFFFFCEKMPFFDSPTVRALMDRVGKLKWSIHFWHEKVRLTWHFTSNHLFMNLNMTILAL